MKLTNLVGGLLLAFAATFAHSASLVVLPQQLVVDADGDPRSGAKLYTYQSGTTTALTTYTTPALSTAHANPIVAVSTGLFPSIYLPASVSSYKLVLKDSADVTIYTEDNIPVVASSGIVQTADETSAGVVAENLEYPPGHGIRYGAECDGATDDTAAIQAAIDYASEVGGTAIVPTGTCLVDTLTFDASGFTISGEGRGSILKASTNIPTTDIGGAILVSLAGGTDEATNQALLDTVYGADVVLVRSSVTGSMENVIIRDLTFQGRNDGTTAIWATGFTRGGVFENLHITDFEECGLRLNGSWSFTADHVFVDGDGTGGTGFCFGISGHGTRNSQLDVNGVHIANVEITLVNQGITWNVGKGNFIGGSIFEGLDADGITGQSLDATSFVGNYCENVAGECIDVGGTNGSDFADGWLIAGNHFNQDSGTPMRIDGMRYSQLGPNNSVGSNANVYVMTTGEGVDTVGNTIFVPAVNNTYIGNSSELDLTDNFVIATLAGSEQMHLPRARIWGEVGFYGTSPVAQQVDIGAMTDAGTGNDAVQDVTAGFDQTILNNNFADVVEQLNQIRTILRNYGLMP